ncbi:MAG: tol-pal system protein YbgF [Myxococcota bacterium]
MVCSSIRWGMFALGLGLLAGGCTHAQTPAETVAPGAENSSAALRRENATLKRRVQMLEDRMLRVERVALEGAPSEPVAAARPRAEESLPVYEVEPQTAGAGPSDVPPSDPNAGYTIGELQPAEYQDERLWNDPTGLARAPEPEPESEDSTGGGSYRLVGNELVQMTDPGKPKPADKPIRGKKGRSMKAEYDAAMALLKRGEHDAAAAAFADFIAAHPRSDLADNAMYWKGEAAYDQAHYADALASFTAVVERYAGGNKASDALLKIGLCYAKLGDRDNARDVLNRLIEAYPGAASSDVARVKLAELSS